MSERVRGLVLRAAVAFQRRGVQSFTVRQLHQNIKDKTAETACPALRQVLEQLVNEKMLSACGGKEYALEAEPTEAQLRKHHSGRGGRNSQQCAKCRKWFWNSDPHLCGARANSDLGHFYAVQLLPELVPDRIKLGFSTNVPDRLRQYRMANPEARILNVWPCLKQHEWLILQQAEAWGTRVGAREVYNVTDLQSFIQNIDAYMKGVTT